VSRATEAVLVLPPFDKGLKVTSTKSQDFDFDFESEVRMGDLV